MYARNEAKRSVREQSDLISQILLQQGDLPEAGLTATRLEVTPSSKVKAGDTIYVPSGAVRDM